MHNRLYKTVLAAMFASMICVATMIIQIPIPGTGGYANLGDGILLACAYLLPTGYAVAAAAIGSALADMLCGYALFIPGTFLIKGGIALIVSLLARKFLRADASRKASFLIRLCICIAGEAFMVAGYFAYEAIALSYGLGAAAAIPGNLMQGAVGIAVALLLSGLERRIFHEFFHF